MNKYIPKSIKILTLFGCVGFLMSCSQEEEKEKKVALPVYDIDTSTVTVEKNFLGTVEGKVNVEIRPQVKGELQAIYVDEGDHVEKGEKLFKIDPQPYREDVNEAIANANTQEAKLANAKVEVERLKPLIEHEVMAPVRLETAEKEYDVAEANLKQAKAKVENAQIQLDYTTITAPVKGYIGRIPKRVGNVVKPSDEKAITALTDVDEVYVYFSISESNFYELLRDGSVLQRNKGLEKAAKEVDTTQNISLILSDGTEYPAKGSIDASSGQINKETGSILLRSTFPNEANMLRSGNTATVILSQNKHGKILIPKESTYELQAETFVKKLDTNNRVKRQLIGVEGDAPNNQFIVSKGLERGDQIVAEDVEGVKDSIKVKPMPYKPDTLVAPRSIGQEPEDSSKSNSK